MDSYRSKSCRDGRDMQLENYSYGGTDKDSTVVPSGMMTDLPRSYSTNHVSSSSVHPPPPPGYNYMMGKEIQIKKVKNSSSSQAGSIGKNWSFNDPELKRKKRVAGYKVYTVEGKMKGSLRKSFRWIKDVVYGWR
ncbi:Type 1 diacylglycerol acyltransferase [Heracleum sosnowskyi]|uniref:Type 1 diacylglycerol acyltransferase n=1 Tax=Heracleum sosnowskyi TaxID=360622 RepID=A0AAD8HAV2_9APIA|nr:Type 1 diacylglycerol acyltransferase [Heracleum sosnowskyi]